MSDLKKIKDEFLSKLSRKLVIADINQIKSDLFQVNLKRLEQLQSRKEKNLLLT